MYGTLAPKAFALYPQNTAGVKEDPVYGGQAAQWVVDTMYRCPVVAQLIWHAAVNPAWEYQFDRPVPGREALGATHGAEVAYVFGVLGPQYSAADREISGAIEEYWTNFAKTGNPNGQQTGEQTRSRQWPKFDTAARGYLEFTADGIVAGEGLRRPYCDLYVENVKRLMGR